MAKPVDPVGERVVGAHAADDDPCPVLVELVVQADDIVAPPPFDLLEAVVGFLLPAEPVHPRGEGVIACTSGRGPPGVVLEPVVQKLSPVAAVAAQPGQPADIAEVACAAGSGGVQLRQRAAPGAQRLVLGRQLVAAVGRSAGQDALVLGDALPKVAVAQPWVVAGRQRGVGSAVEGVGDLLRGVAPVLKIAKRLGHASAAFTQDRYGHLFEDADSQAAAAVAAMVDGAL
jgi:hypothetical protein